MPLDLASLKRALVALDGGDPDLDRLRHRLEKFNIFDAIGMGGLEIRHSNFLAFLLDPRESHGLRDRLAKGLLRRALEKGGNRSVSNLTEVGSWSLIGLEVERERDNIDILMTDHDHRLAVVLENKTGSSEHDDQLRRYAKSVGTRYPGYQTLLLYLTPDGDEPSDPRFVPITYEDIARELRQIIGERIPSANPELLSLLEHHYLPLLRKRDLAPDDELDELASRVYRKHKTAIDFIVRHRGQVGPFEDLVHARPELLLVGSTPTRVGFIPREWKDPRLQVRNDAFGWRLQFQLRDEKRGQYVVLRLQPANDKLGEEIVSGALELGEPFHLESKKRAQDRVFLYRRLMLRVGHHGEGEPADQTDGFLRGKWEGFLSGDFPRLRDGVARILQAVGESKTTSH